MPQNSSGEAVAAGGDWQGGPEGGREWRSGGGEPPNSQRSGGCHGTRARALVGVDRWICISKGRFLFHGNLKIRPLEGRGLRRFFGRFEASSVFKFFLLRAGQCLQARVGKKITKQRWHRLQLDW